LALRIVAAVAGLAVLPQSAEAQDAHPAKPINLAAYHRSGKNMRDFGLPFTVVGTGLAIVGIFEIATAGDTGDLHLFGPPRTPAQQAAYDQKVRGIYLLLGSAGCFGLGLPFLAIGQHRMAKAERLGYVPYVAPTQGGVVMGLRVVTF